MMPIKKITMKGSSGQDLFSMISKLVFECECKPVVLLASVDSDGE